VYSHIQDITNPLLNDLGFGFSQVNNQQSILLFSLNFFNFSNQLSDAISIFLAVAAVQLPELWWEFRSEFVQFAVSSEHVGHEFWAQYFTGFGWSEQ
jgi:hypothetical protein